MNLRTKLTVIYLSISIIPMVLGIVIFYWLEHHNIEQQMIGHLKSVASIQKSRIIERHQQEIELFGLLSPHIRLGEHVKSYKDARSLSLNNNNTDIAITLNKEANSKHKDLEAFVDYLVAYFKRVTSFALYDNNGQLITFTGNRSEIEAQIENHLGNSSPQLFFKYSKQNQYLLQVVGSLHYKGEPIAQVVMNFEAATMLSSIQDYTGLGETGETVVATWNDNHDALFLTPTRHDKSSALKTVISKNNKRIPIIYALNGDERVFTDFTDYRGVPVIAVSRYIENSNWGVVVKIDRQEAYKNLDSMFENLLIIVFSLTLFLFAASILLARRITQPIKELTNTANMIIEGNTSVLADENNQDEIGELGRTFNIMTYMLLSSQKHLEQSLEEINEKNRIISADALRFERWKNSNFIGIAHCDFKGTIRDVNQTFLEVIGYSQSDFDDGLISWQSISVDNDNNDKQALERINASGTFEPYEKHFKTKSGELAPVLIGGASFNDDNSEFIVFVVDLTEQKRQEKLIRKQQDALNQAHKMEALGQLSGGVAHDYNNLLAIIQGYVDLVLMSCDSDSLIYSSMLEIQQATVRATHLSDRLLAYAKEDVVKGSVCNLNELINEQKAILVSALTKRIALTFNFDEQLKNTYINRHGFNDALLNLVINSMHAIEGNGKVEITTKNIFLTLSESAALGVQQGEYVQLCVFDNGCGIEPENLDKLYEPFFTTKGQQGSGLGLTQLYQLVKKYNGAINIDSEYSQYTLVQLYFPVSDEIDKERSESTPDTELNINTDITILICDDEVQLVDAISQQLEHLRFNIIKTYDTDTALDCIGNNNVDILLSDVILSESSGYELAYKVHQSHPDIKVQLMSGFSDLDNESFDLSGTADNTSEHPYMKQLKKQILKKPFTLEQLLERISLLQE